ncbi:MAG: hypothetical protein ACXAAO_07190 [Candidatus Thorarchaeota archaeon]
MDRPDVAPILEAENPVVETQTESDEDKSEPENEQDELVFRFHPDNLPEDIRSNPPLAKKATKIVLDESVAFGNLDALTKEELIQLVPDDYKETSTEKKLKTLTKKELVSLIELLRFRDTL